MTIQGKQASQTTSIAVIGVGGIGSAFAFQLARVGGHQVTAIARPGSLRLEQLGRTGGIVNKRNEKAELEVLDKLDEQVRYDLVLVTLRRGDKQIQQILLVYLINHTPPKLFNFTPPTREEL